MKTVKAAFSLQTLDPQAAMNRVFTFAMLAGVLLAVASGRPVSGQSAFAFSIGSGGGGHHHHHHGGWRFGYATGPWWGPGWYAPPPAVIYAPPPVVQDRVIYVQPQSPPPTVISPYSSSIAQPPPNIAAAPAAASGSTGADDRIVIRNAAAAQLPVAFVVDGQDVELADGSTRTFVGKTQRTVQYDRGGKFGSTQQDLTGGQYEFRITATGWDLVRRAESAASRTAVRANTLPSGATR